MGVVDIEALRGFCLSLPYVKEDFPFDESTLVFKVGGKVFALLNIDSFDFINLKCNPEFAVELRERYSGITPGYHMNKKHWNTVQIDGSFPARLLPEWTRHSYDLVLASLPAKVRLALDAGSEL